jgi:ABC-type nitrate/sulfonate/bicarbonate transport system substrate-binding protein
MGQSKEGGETPNMPTRRKFLAGAAAAAAMAGCPAIIGQAVAAEPVTVFCPFSFSTEYSDLMNAYSGGHFAQQGLDAKVISAMGVQSVQQLVAGQGEFMRNAGVDIIKGISQQGLPLICIATIDQASTYQFVSLKSKPVNGVEDLKGKTVGILTAAGGASSTYLEVILAKAGLAKENVNMMVTGNNPAELQYVKDGRIDCFMCTLDVAIVLERAGEPIHYWSVDRYAPMPSYVHVTRRDVIEQRPELVQRYMRAIKASVNEILTKPLAGIFAREAKDFEVQGIKDMKLAVDLQQILIDRLWLTEGRQNVLHNMPARWATAVDNLRGLGLKGLQEPTAYYTNRFIDAT